MNLLGGLGGSVKKLELLITANTSQAVLGVSNLQRQTQGLGSQAGNVTSKVGGLGGAIGKIAPYAKVAAGAMVAVGAGAVAMAKPFAETAARAETLNAAMQAVAKSTNNTMSEVNSAKRAIMDKGIAEIEATQITIRFMQSQLDLANASKLARIAQDAAVIAGENSSQAAETMVEAIAKLRPELLRQYGMTRNLNDIYADYAEKLGIVVKKKNAVGRETSQLTRNLTETEKKQAMLNYVMGEGAKIAGTYETAMGTVGKKLGSLDRIWQTFQIAIAKPLLLPAFGGIVDGITQVLKVGTEWAERNEASLKAVGNALGRIFDFSGAIKLLQDVWETLGKSTFVQAALEGIRDAWRDIKAALKDVAPDLKKLWVEALPIIKAVLIVIGQLVVGFVLLAAQIIRVVVPVISVLVNALRFLVNIFKLVADILTLNTKAMKKDFQALADSGKKIIKGLADALLAIVGTSTDKIVRYFKRMRTGSTAEMKGTADSAGYQGLRLDKHFSNWAKSAHKWLVQNIGQSITSAIRQLATFPGRGSRAISPFINVIVSWCSNWGRRWRSATLSWISQIVSFFKNMPGRILNAIKGFSLFQWGKNLITSIWSGIKSGLRGGPSSERGGDLDSMASAFFGKLGLFSGGAKGWGLQPLVAGIAKTLSSLFGLSITSGFRPGARTASGRVSLHSLGKAVDLGGSSNAMRAAFMLATRIPGVREAIYGHMIYKPGRGIGYWARNDHLDHVHVGTFHQGGVVGGAGDVLINARAGEVVTTSAQFRKFANAIDKLNLVLGRISYMQTRFNILQSSQNYPDWVMKFFPSQMGRLASGGYAFGDAARQTAVSLRMANVKNDIEGVAAALNSIADLRSKFASHIQEVFDTAKNAIEQWGNKAKKEIEDTLKDWEKYYAERLKQIDAERKASDKYYEEEFSKLDALSDALAQQRAEQDQTASRARETESALAALSEKRQELAELEAQQFLTAEDVAKINTLRKEVYDQEQALAQKQADWAEEDKRAAEDAELEAQRKALEQQQEAANEQYDLLEENLNAQNELEQEKAQERLDAIEEEANKRLSTIAENLYAINKAYDDNLNQIVATEGSYLSTSTAKWQAWNESVLNAYRSVMAETGGALGTIGGLGGIGAPSIGGLPSGLAGASAAGGKPITWMTPGKVINGHALVPVRELAAALGATSLNWDAANQRASFYANGTSISYKVGLASVDIGKTHVGLPVAPYQSGGVMYVPARIVGERLGANVLWQGGKVGVQFHRGGKVPWSGWHQLLKDERVFPESRYSVLDEFLTTGKLPALTRGGRVNVNHSFGRFVAEMHLIVDGDISTMEKEKIEETVNPLIKQAKREIETKIIKDYESATTYSV